MANNKIQLADGTTLIDLTEDTVAPDALLSGYVAHDKSGQKITGTVTAMTSSEILQAVTTGWNAS